MRGALFAVFTGRPGCDYCAKHFAEYNQLQGNSLTALGKLCFSDSNMRVGSEFFFLTMHNDDVIPTLNFPMKTIQLRLQQRSWALTKCHYGTV